MLALLALTDAQPTGKHKYLAASGGGIRLDKDRPERTQLPSPTGPVLPYSGPPKDLAPVRAVRSGKLRDMPPIDPETVAKLEYLEPIPPRRPTENGGSQGPIQSVAGPLTSAPAPTGVNFEGVGVGLAGFSPSSNPPDVNGRVGATQYVQWNNASFAVFNKATGALEYGPAAGNTLFQALGGVCAAHNDGDPVVSYDILAGRWVLSQFVVGGPAGGYSHQCFAISTTSDATGEYYLYDFVTDPVNFIDYPHTGVWPDGYYMSSHVFSAGPVEVPVAVPGAFITARVYVFEREKMIKGLAARMQSVDLGQQYGLLPADLDSLTPPPAGEAEFVLGPDFAFFNRTDSTRVQVTWDPAPAIAVIPGVILAGIDDAPCVNGKASPARDCVPQPPPAVGLDYLDNISGHLMYRLAYRNNGTQAAPQESLVVSGPSAGGPTHGAVEWFEFRNAGSSTTQPTLFQSGTFDPDTDYRWLPSIAMDKDGNIALGYSKSSTTVKPGIYITGRLASDPAGTMGGELEMQAGLGVQVGSSAGNRWGDYSSMTLDPIDQCTFYYTNEYLKTNGAFNWSTRIASYKFPSCGSAAGLYGTVTGTITSSETGAPIPGVTVTLSNGYAGASDATGVYTILVPAGTYTATAADPKRNCAAAAPASATVAPTGGGSATQNFAMTGTSKIEGNGVTLDDSLGNNNQIVNRAECVKLNLGLKNNGCAKETAISATLTTTTPGVTVVDANSNYPDMVIDAGATNTTPFKILVTDSFVCGTQIALSLNLTYASGTKTISYSVPSCAGGANQTIPAYTLTTSDATQTDRIGRDGAPSTCGGKVSPGGGFTGTHWYKAFTFTNTSGAPICYTVTINAGLNGPGDIESVAYDQVYDPANISTNYLGDSGISGLGTTVDKATYSFTVPGNHNFVVVVNTTGSTTSGTTASSQFSGTISGYVDNTAGPGSCSGSATPTPTPTPTATPEPTATATPEPTATATPESTATATPTPTATATPTPTATATPEPTATATPEPTATATPEPTATATPTPTPTPQPTATATATPTATATATATPIPTATATPLPTATATATPIATATATPTATPVATATATVAPTATASPSPTATATATSTPTPTATATATPTATPSGSATRAVNLSTRMRSDIGDNAGIGGFIITGSGPKHVIVRGLGPSLTRFGFPSSDLLADPTLELHGPNGFSPILNNNWRDSQESEILNSGLAPTDDLESAIDATLSPGAYTAILRGNGSGVGIGTVEIYDRDVTGPARLANLSTRAFVRTGSSVVIAGFILGNNGGSDRILIRGLGPSLSAFGISNPLQNPTLELRNQNGTLLKSNDDWGDDPAQFTEIVAAGLPPPDPKESAMAVSLLPGPYTAILAGLNDGEGVGTVEVYDRGP